MNEEDLEEKVEMSQKRWERMAEMLKNAPVVKYRILDPTMCVWNNQQCDLCGREGIIEEPDWYPELKRMQYDVRECYAVIRGKRLLRESGLQGEEVRHSFENAVIDDFNREVIARLKEWEPIGGRGLILSSHRTKINPLGNGTGKSYMLHALTIKLCLEGYACKYGRTVDFLAELRRAYNSDDGSEYDITQKYIDCGVLLWDDMGKENIRSDWAPERFYYVIDRRITLRRPMVISTNLTVAEIEEHFGKDNFGPAIVSRLLGSCDILYLDGYDRRLTLDA